MTFISLSTSHRAVQLPHRIQEPLQSSINFTISGNSEGNHASELLRIPSQTLDNISVQGFMSITRVILGQIHSNTTFIYLFGFDLFWFWLRFQHITSHITTGSFMPRGNQYIQLVKVLYCKLLTSGKPPPYRDDSL